MDDEIPYDPSCPFCRIGRGEEQTRVVFESATSLAFLDKRPLFPGHVLVTPKGHYPTLTDVPAPLLGPLFEDVALLARAVESAMSAGGTFVAMNNKVSQSVHHLHVHVVPRTKGDGLKGFFWPRHGYTDEEHERETADAIREAVRRLG